VTILALATEPIAIDVKIADAMLRVVLDDGREIAAPVAWFPRLRDATAAQSANWRLIGRGEGIHWPDIDEDISVESLLGGQPNTAGQSSKPAA
jgi:hypothetical protein